MADLGGEHVVNPKDTMDDRTPIPAGDYPAVVTDSDVKPTKSNNGGMVMALTFTVIEGPYSGRKVFDNVNIRNPNQQAQEIGRKQMNSIGAAIGLGAFRNTIELHEKPMVISVGIDPAKGDYPAKNKITAYKPIGQQQQQAPVQQQPGVQQQASATYQRPATTTQGQPALVGGGAAPWKR